MVFEAVLYYMIHIGCPRFLRADMGTENSSLAIVQPILLGTMILIHLLEERVLCMCNSVSQVQHNGAKIIFLG